MSNRSSDGSQPNVDNTAERLHSRIGVNVLRALGQPDHLHMVQVRPLWAGHYRVNVLVGGSAAAVTVAHSYFLTADGEGNVVAATPALARRY
jgi:hypothetical protein